MTRIFFILFLCCDFNRALGATAIQSDANRKDQKPPSEGFAEYFLDHQVSEKQARDSLLHMNSDAFVNPAHCKPCTHEEKQYCKSENLLKDHCCCNQGHRIGEFNDPKTQLIARNRFHAAPLFCLPFLAARLAIIRKNIQA